MADCVHVFEIINLRVLVEWNYVKQYISFSVLYHVSRQLGYSEDVVCMPPTVLKLTRSAWQSPT